MRKKSKATTKPWFSRLLRHQATYLLTYFPRTHTGITSVDQ